MHNLPHMSSNPKLGVLLVSTRGLGALLGQGCRPRSSVGCQGYKDEETLIYDVLQGHLGKHASLAEDSGCLGAHSQVDTADQGSGAVC